jgi:hypothetical protein
LWNENQSRSSLMNFEGSSASYVSGMRALKAPLWTNEEIICLTVPFALPKGPQQCPELIDCHCQRHVTKTTEHNRIFHGANAKNSHFENSIVQICFQRTSERVSEKLKFSNLLCLLICARRKCDTTRTAFELNQ